MKGGYEGSEVSLDGWCEGGLVQQRNDGGGMTVNARKIGKSGEPLDLCNSMSFMLPFLLGPVFFRTAFLCSGGYRLERGGMPLHDAVVMN